MHVVFVQRDLSEAGLGPVVAASLEAQPGKHFRLLMLFNRITWVGQ